MDEIDFCREVFNLIKIKWNVNLHNYGDFILIKISESKMFKISCKEVNTYENLPVPKRTDL